MLTNGSGHVRSGIPASVRPPGFALAFVLCVLNLAGVASDGARDEARPSDTPHLLWGELEPGPYAVGFEAVELEDASREFAHASTRPLRISLWYPAVSGTGAPMRYRGYIEYHERPLAAVSTEQRDDTGAVVESWALRNGYDAEFRDRLLSAPTAARRDARPADDGPFPLVLYAAGYRATMSPHTVTAEYLASHGYIVAGLPSVGASPAGITFDSAGLDLQARDLEFTLGAISARPMARGAETAVMGFSFGGGAALLAAMRRPSIDAVVGLDSVMGARHVFAAVRGAPGFHEARARIPLLEIGRPDVPWRDLELMRSLRLAHRSWIEVEGVEHLDFIPKATLGHALGETVPARRLQTYRETLAAVRAFLDLHLHPPPGPSGATAPESGSTEASLLQHRNFPAGATATASHTYRALLRAPESALDAIVRYRNESEALGGMVLVEAGHFDDAAGSHLPDRPELAAEIHRLWVEELPESVAAWTGLGDALAQLGARREALAAYESALTLDPASVFARLGAEALEQSEGDVRTQDHDEHDEGLHVDGLTYELVPAGAFMLGCVAGDTACEAHEHPARRVILTRRYWMSATEVTIAAFRRFVEATGFVPSSELGSQAPRGRMYMDPPGEWHWVPGLSWARPLDRDTPGDPDWPVVQVSTRDAAAYCAWAGGRLPSEAEWERAARGGRDGSIYSWGSVEPESNPSGRPLNGPDLSAAARYPTMETWAGYDDGYANLAPVASFPANDYGLHDMAGNVYEYTSTFYSPDAYRDGAARDPEGPVAGDSIVARGGAWGYAPAHQRLSWRGYFDAAPEFWTATLGFRCALDRPPEGT